MNLFGLSITRAAPRTLSPAPATGHGSGWHTVFRGTGDAYVGSWQQDVHVNTESVLAYNAVFACMTLIARDIAKLRVKLVAKDNNGIWSETTNPAYSPVLRKPNSFQTRNQFWESWMLSKLSRGNAYALKGRDQRGVVTSLQILDPARVTPMVSEDGAVWYQLASDNIAGLKEATVIVPAREIIHDRFNCLFHPLVGLSPIFACGLAATQGLRIQEGSSRFFGNNSRPGGLLIAPGRIPPEDAVRLKEYWDAGFTGQNAGKIAVLGDGLRYESIAVTAEDSQLIEQLKWTAEVVCSCFHVPPYKIGVGSLPSYNNVQALNVEYYSQCLQSHIEEVETSLDEGLATGDNLGTEFDIDNLLRMDGVTQMDVLTKGAGILKIDEMRAKLDKPPVEGGDTVYLQQQNYSLEALAKRDAQEDPFGSSTPAPAPAPQTEEEPPPTEEAKGIAKAALRQMIRERAYA